MTATTTPWGFVYPVPTDNTQLWTYFQSLAQALNDQLPYTGSSWTPAVSQSEDIGLPTSVASTPDADSCLYWVLGKIVTAQASVTLTAAGSGGIAVSLPLPAADVAKTVGPGRVLAASPPANQAGLVSGWTVDKVAFLDNAGLNVKTAPNGARLSFTYTYVRA